MSRSAPWPAIMVSYARRVMGTQPLPRPRTWLARFAQFFVFSHHRHRRSEVSRCKHDEENRHGAPPRPNPATMETRPRAVHKPTAVMFVFCCSPSLVALPSGDAVQTWGSVYEVSSDRSGENVRHNQHHRWVRRNVVQQLYSIAAMGPTTAPPSSHARHHPSHTAKRYCLPRGGRGAPCAPPVRTHVRGVLFFQFVFRNQRR